MIIRKLFIVSCLAYFVSNLILWGFFDVPFTTTAAVVSTLLCSWMLVKDFVLVTYIEYHLTNL